MYPFSHSLGVALCAQKAQLLREAADFRCDGEELFRELFAEATELRVISIFWVVASTVCSGLGCWSVEEGNGIRDDKPDFPVKGSDRMT